MEGILHEPSIQPPFKNFCAIALMGGMLARAQRMPGALPVY